MKSQKLSLSPNSLEFFAGITEATVESSRVYPGQSVDSRASSLKNSFDYPLIRPGGRRCYPGVWTQDFAMTLATGFVTDQEMLQHLRLIALGQNGPTERPMTTGAVVPPHAVPDHLLFNGAPVYFPGTYSAGDDQGSETWGLRPPSNNPYDFILIAWQLWKSSGDHEFLLETLNGLPLIERLRLGFAVPRIDETTGLIYTEAASRAVGFIFCDSIYFTGHLLTASLLRWRAGYQLAELERALGNPDRALAWKAEVDRLLPHLVPIFGDPGRIGGWLMAATEIGRQPDVWGTIYALYLGLLKGNAAKAALAEIVHALEEGTIVREGALRHVPTNHDAAPDRVWEKTPTQKNRYQNGAYWHTPTGWLIAVLSESHPDWASRIFEEMIAHLRREDFRQGPEFNGPWECFGPEPEASNNPLFLASVTLPYGIVKDL